MLLVILHYNTHIEGISYTLQEKEFKQISVQSSTGQYICMHLQLLTRLRLFPALYFVVVVRTVHIIGFMIHINEHCISTHAQIRITYILSNCSVRHMVITEGVKNYNGHIPLGVTQEELSSEAELLSGSPGNILNLPPSWTS